MKDSYNKKVVRLASCSLVETFTLWYYSLPIYYLRLYTAYYSSVLPRSC